MLDTCVPSYIINLFTFCSDISRSPYQKRPQKKGSPLKRLSDAPPHGPLVSQGPSSGTRPFSVITTRSSDPVSPCEIPSNSTEVPVNSDEVPPNADNAHPQKLLMYLHAPLTYPQTLVKCIKRQVRFLCPVLDRDSQSVKTVAARPPSPQTMPLTQAVHTVTAPQFDGTY